MTQIVAATTSEQEWVIESTKKSVHNHLQLYTTETPETAPQHHLWWWCTVLTVFFSYVDLTNGTDSAIQSLLHCQHVWKHPSAQMIHAEFQQIKMTTYKFTVFTEQYSMTWSSLRRENQSTT